MNEMTLTNPTTEATPSEAAYSQLLFDFRDPDSTRGWFILNDGVMGGVSHSRFQRDPEGWLRFSGVVRPDNNGGFASVEARWYPADLSAHDGLRLRVRGDGQRYTVYLRDAAGPIVHQAKFDTAPGAWHTVNLPFAAFVPVWYGQRVLARRLDPRTLQGMSLMIEDEQFGSFTLEVARIGLYRSALV